MVYGPDFTQHQYLRRSFSILSLVLNVGYDKMNLNSQNGFPKTTCINKNQDWGQKIKDLPLFFMKLHFLSLIKQGK